MRPAVRSDATIAALIAAFAVLLYEITGVGRPTFFDYDARLASAFLEGHWWLGPSPSYLNELVPCGAERWCVPYPPLPAFLALPFVLVFPSGTAQTLASAVYGGLAAAPAYLAIRAVGASRGVAVVTTVFAVAGTTAWFTSSTADVWFYAHAVAMLFASLAALAALRGWPAWSVGALVGAAALARFPLALALPALAYATSATRGGGFPRQLALAAAGALPFALVEVAYDLLRWGAPEEAGYAYLTSGNPETPYGLFDIRYLPGHLYAIFLRPPAVGAPPFVLRPSLWGLSMLLLSPAYLFLIPAVARLRRHPALGALLAAALLALLPDLLHGGVGARQLGYRFSLDAQPFLLPLVAIGATRGDGVRSPLLVPAVIWSVVATAYSTVAIATVGYAP